MLYEVFHAGWKGYKQGLMCTLEIVSSAPTFFLQTWVVSSYTSAAQYSVIGLRGILSRSLKLSLCKALFFEVLFPVNFSCSGLHRLPALSPQHKETAGTLLPVLQPGNSLQAEAGNHRAHLISFSSLRNCYFVLLSVQYLKTVVSYIFI